MRSEPLAPDRAIAARRGTGIVAAPRDVPRAAPDVAAAEAIRRELSRLTALLRRHFSVGAVDSLLPALVNTSDAGAAASARQFIDLIQGVAEMLEAHAARWTRSAALDGAFADFRREMLALLQGVEERLPH